MNVITVKNIEKHFGRNGLSNTSFGLKQGDYLCITGGSGCGKTTLLNIISGMLKADKGEVILNGKDIYSSMDERSRTKLRNKKIGYMMQGNTLIPELDIISNIRCPLELNGIKVKKERILEIAEKLKITNVLRSYPSEISGGEYRRVLLARTLIMEPEILIADEPTSNLDEKSAETVREIFDEYISDKEHILIISTHDRAFLNKCSHILELTQMEISA